MPRTGRPEKLDKNKIEGQIEMMAALGIRKVMDVAYVFGVNPKIMGRYFKKYPELEEAFNRGKARGALKLKRKAWDMALGGNPDMLKFCLKNLTEWQEREQDRVINERPQVIVYLPAVDNDPRKIEFRPVGEGSGRKTIEVTNGDEMDSASRPTD